VLLQKTLFASCYSRRLRRKSLILDVDEASGAPRLTAQNVFTSESRIGLLCHNDPIDFTDPMGTDYGDLFSSSHAAARDFNRIYNPVSISKNVEYGSSIYKDASGRYSYTKPAEGTFHDSRPRNSIPDRTKLVGDIHSHGDYSRGYTDKDGHLYKAERVSRTNPNYRALDNFDSDNPSRPDKRFWHNQGKGKDEYTGYLTTPSREMWKMNGVDQNSKPEHMSPQQQQQQRQMQQQQTQQFESPYTRYFIQLVH